MKDTSTRISAGVTYELATLVDFEGLSATSLPSPRQRVVTASHVQESVVIRFTPRNVQRSASETKTS